MAEPFASPLEHLLAELDRLDLLFSRQVLELRVAERLTSADFRAVRLSDERLDELLADEDGRAEPQRITRAVAALEESIRVRLAASRRVGRELPFPKLARLFGLCRFEVDALTLALASELDHRYAALIGFAQADPARRQPSFDLALSLFCRSLAERVACLAYLAPESTLVSAGLIEVFPPPDAAPHGESSYRMDARALDYLLGGCEIDRKVRRLCRLLTEATPLEELHLPGSLRDSLSAAMAGLAGRPGAFLFHGPQGSGKEAAAAALCQDLGQSLLCADLGLAPPDPDDFASVLGLLEREARLQDAGLYLGRVETILGDGPREQALARFLARSRPITFAGSEAAWSIPRAGDGFLVHFEFRTPDFTLRESAWSAALGRPGLAVAPEVSAVDLANRFVLTPGQIRDAVGAAADQAVARGGEALITSRDLNLASRQQSTHALSRLAQRVEPVYCWSDIVLPPRPMQQLREVFASLKFRHIVYSRWGFDRKMSLGKGLKILFSGPSGTGKTMAAEILAYELDLDLYKIDLASVLSKYIGEIEQNLARLFREAETVNAILFFDEADALFGKRSDVHDAHDRYANLEVAYLLQRMEEYDGVVVLATNLLTNVDEAFARRMHHTVEFPAPNAEQRERIWREVFPADAPLADDVDYSFLGRQLKVVGGNIRNIALAAAFTAAEEGGTITMERVLRATAREFQKTGRLPSRAEFGSYFELVKGER